MNCPKCGTLVATFFDWYFNGKTLKAECPNCKVQLVASKGTKFTINVLVILMMLGVLLIGFVFWEQVKNTEKIIGLYILIYGCLVVVPTGYVLFNKYCGYVEK